MIHGQQQTLESFLDAAAARQPAPGGGSVTGLVGALAASMGEMVLNYSIGKKDLMALEPEFKTVLSRMHHARQMLLALMVEDQVAFEELTAVRKLPVESPERAAKYNPALLAAITVPQSMGATALALLELAEQVAPSANRFLLSDLAVCADLAMATVRCSIYNVRVNLDSLSASECQRFESESAALLARATQCIQRLAPAIWKRIESPK